MLKKFTKSIDINIKRCYYKKALKCKEQSAQKEYKISIKSFKKTID